jgi:hypothetical protein
MTTPFSATRLSAVMLAAALLGLVAAGCGGSSETISSQMDATAPKPAPQETTAKAPPPTPPSPRILSTATGIATDPEGDRAEVTVEMGEAVPMTETDDETALACETEVSQLRSSPERSIAIPFTVSVTVLSTLATDVVVNLDSFGAVKEGGDVDPNGEESFASLPLWAGGYSDGPTCTDWTDVGNGAGSVHWDSGAARPQVEQSWNAWLVLPDAINPRDPTGAQEARLVVEQPAVTLSGLADYKIDLDQSSGIVKCFSEYSLIPGDVAVMAEDSSAAIGAGCSETSATASEGGLGSKVDSDAICMSRYPSGQIRDVSVKGGSERIYDRQASLENVCAGFGAPEDLQLTAGMSCALIAAAAVWGGPEVNAGSSELCDTTAIVEGYDSGGWVGVSSSVAEEKACGYFSDVFAGGAGVVAAGAASESGPGAVAVGLGTYKALASFLNVACGGLLDGGATALGTKLETDHETHVALDVTRRGKCLMLSQKSGFSGTSWHAVECPDASV